MFTLWQAVATTVNAGVIVSLFLIFLSRWICHVYLFTNRCICNVYLFIYFQMDMTLQIQNTVGHFWGHRLELQNTRKPFTTKIGYQESQLWNCIQLSRQCGGRVSETKSVMKRFASSSSSNGRPTKEFIKMSTRSKRKTLREHIIQRL